MPLVSATSTHVVFAPPCYCEWLTTKGLCVLGASSLLPDLGLTTHTHPLHHNHTHTHTHAHTHIHTYMAALNSVALDTLRVEAPVVANSSGVAVLAATLVASGRGGLILWSTS